MLSAKEDALHQKAALLASLLAEAGIAADIVPTEGRVGGGSVPNQSLVSYAIALDGNVEALEEKLRLGIQPIIGRIHEGRYLLDVRTLFEADFPVIVEALKEARL
jgi:L-seryl-tRNA(Ser) seleniumtransferase